MPRRSRAELLEHWAHAPADPAARTPPLDALARVGGAELLQAAAALLDDPDPRRRAAAAAVLGGFEANDERGRLGGDPATRRPRCAELLRTRADREEDPAVREAITAALTRLTA